MVPLTVQRLRLISQNNLTYIKLVSHISLKFYTVLDLSPDILYLGLTLESFMRNREQRINLVRVTLTLRAIRIIEKDTDLRTSREREQVSRTFKKCLLHFQLLVSLLHHKSIAPEGNESSY